MLDFFRYQLYNCNMTHILEQIGEMRPVFRMSDRKATIDFFTSVLGLKLLKEENSMLHFGGGQTEQTRIICAVSPESLDFHAATSQKRHLLTILNYEQEELKGLLLHNLSNVQRVTHSSSFGYAFTTVSPDGDSFVVQSGEDPEIIELKKESISADELAASAGEVSDIEVVSTMICSPNGQMFYQEKLGGAFIHAVPMQFEESEDTWDIESAQFVLNPGVKLFDLVFKLDELDYLIDSETKTLIVNAPDGFELQFIERK
jgi:catechol 2,3-dioxygenase-like lactoylglutathione lyase family enzyme